MEEKWNMDFKKLRKSSSKKLIKGGLGFFLSPRDEVKDISRATSNTSQEIPFMVTTKKINEWGTDSVKPESNSDAEGNEKDYIDDIPVIPSIDDFADDGLSHEIAKAPLIGIKRLASYKELENDVLRHSAFANFEEVNLRALIKLLHPESFLNEPDIPWTKDGLFYELVSKTNGRLV